MKNKNFPTSTKILQTGTILMLLFLLVIASCSQPGSVNTDPNGSGDNGNTIDSPNGKPPANSNYKQLTKIELADGATNPFMDRTNFGFIRFNDKFWVIGGRNGGTLLNDIWSSPDGKTWTQDTSVTFSDKEGNSIDFPPRSNMGVAILKGELFITGGVTTNGIYLLDVWKTSNGKDWNRVVNESPVTGFQNFELVSFKGFLINFFRIDPGTEREKIDVFFSDNGGKWTKRIEENEFDTQNGLTPIVFNNTLYIMESNGKIWTSTEISSNGFSLEEKSTLPFSGRRSFKTAIFDNRLWVAGGTGENDATMYNDFYWTEDVVTWHQAEVTESTPLGLIEIPSNFSGESKLFVVGGSSSGSPEDMNTNDLWYLESALPIEPGRYWKQVIINAIDINGNTVENFLNRSGFATVVHKGKLWIIGGYRDGQFLNDVWSSEDGINWDQINDNGDFGKRRRPQAVSFKNKLWLMGGDNNSQRFNDVWSSENGVIWENVLPDNAAPDSMEVTEKDADGNTVKDKDGKDVVKTIKIEPTQFERRTSFSATVFDDEIWVAGGWEKAGTSHKDLWSSTDGITWIKRTDDILTEGLFGSGSFVHDNYFYIIGGNNDNNNLHNQVQQINRTDSTQVATGIVANGSLFSPRVNIGAVSFKDKFYVLGGNANSTLFQDVWSSSDNGMTWTELRGPNTLDNIKDEDGNFVLFDKRFSHGAVVFKDKLWVIGGDADFSKNNQYNDIWYTE